MIKIAFVVKKTKSEMFVFITFICRFALQPVLLLRLRLMLLFFMEAMDMVLVWAMLDLDMVLGSAMLDLAMVLGSAIVLV